MQPQDDPYMKLRPRGATPAQIERFGDDLSGVWNINKRTRGPDTGTTQFLLYGLVGLAPALLSSWLAHRYADEPRPAHST